MSEDARRMTNPINLYSKIGEPIQIPPVRLDGAPLSPGIPSIVVWDAATGVPSDDITPSYLPVMLSDFGESFEPAITKRLHAHTLPTLIPPESFFTRSNSDIDSISFASDMWTLACSIWEVLGDSPPFLPWGKSQDEILLQHVKVLGKLPEAWWSSWETRSECLDEKEEGIFLVKQNCCLQDCGTRRSLEKTHDWCIAGPRRTVEFEDVDFQSPDEKRAFLDMTQMMLVFEPSKRATIDVVLGCE